MLAGHDVFLFVKPCLSVVIFPVMAKILQKKLVRPPDVFYYKIAAPLISKKARPGQFVIIRLHEKGERIPLSLADINPAEGTISLIVMAVGKTTAELSRFREGDEILDLCGPLGQPTHIENTGRVVLVGGGFGAAPLYPIARAFKAAGNHVTIIMGARNKDLLIYEEEMQKVCDAVLVTTPLAPLLPSSAADGREQDRMAALWDAALALQRA